MSSRRAEAFSDGVFAVAITLLVFNLLGVGADGLGRHPYHVLLSAWPNYFAYAVSFLTIGIMWINHHAMFSAITQVDRWLLIINLVALMGVVAIPFPTALVAQELAARFAGTGHAREFALTGGKAAAVAYGVVMIAISIGYSGIWMYIAAHLKKLGAVRDLEVPHVANLQFSAGLFGYVAATLIAAFVSGLVALIIYGLLAIYYMFEHLPGRGDPGSGDEPADPDEAMAGEPVP
jgi:uncharacterized membrane protein